MVLITNFGDVTTTGSMTVLNSLTVLGQFTAGTSIVTGGPSGTIGNTASPFSQVWTSTLTATTANVTSIYGTKGFVGVGTTDPQGTSLYIQGNLYSSNAISSPNLFATTINAIYINALSFVTIPLLNVQGNIYVSNSLSVTNVFASGTLNATTINTSGLVTAGSIGIGTSRPGTTNLYVQGNIYVSNALSTTNVFVSGSLSAAIISMNSLTFYSLGIGANPGTTGLYVQGNAYVSNALTATNVFITGSLNIASLILTSNLGIGTNPGTTNLYVQGNMYVSNSLTTQTIYYGEDLFKRGPYLPASPANAGTIQAWISATCNASNKPSMSWWATSPQPVFGIVTSPTGYNGCLYLPDGRVAMMPSDKTTETIGIYNPATTLFSSITIPATTKDKIKYKSGVLAPNGNIVLCPNSNANIGIFNTISYAWSNVINPASSASGDWSGGVLTPSGNVVFSPMGGNIVELNTTTLAVSNILSVGSLNIWQGVVLLPNGNIVMVPQTSPNILVYNNQITPGTISNVPYSSAPSFIGGVLTPNGNVAMIPVSSANVCIFNPNPPFSFSNIASGGARFQGGVLLPNGNIICVPNKQSVTSNIGMIDPYALTFSNSTPVGINPFNGGVLLPNGQVILAADTYSSGVGVLNTMVPVDPAFCLSPFFNKY